MYLTVCLLVFCFCVALLTHVRSSAGDERCAAGSGVALVFACSRRRRLCRVEWRAESESMSHSIFRSSLILLTALLRASHCTSCGLRATGLRAALRPVIERGAFSSLPPLFQQGPGLPSVSCNCSHSLHCCCVRLLPMTSPWTMLRVCVSSSLRKVASRKGINITHCINSYSSTLPQRPRSHFCKKKPV